MARQSHDVRVPVDNFWIETVKFSVTGSGVGDMTGSIIEGTNLNGVLTFVSGAFPSIPGNMPSGSWQFTLPGGNSQTGLANGRYPRVMSWHATMEAPGVDVTMDARASINSYQLVQYGHNSASGTFAGGFVTYSGSIANGGTIVAKGAVPADRVNPAGPNAARVNLTFLFRGSNRGV